MRRLSIISFFGALFLWASVATASAAIEVRGASSADNGDGATALTLPRPDGLEQGDQMVVQLTMLAGATTPAITAPSGWAQIASTASGASAGRVLQRVYRKRADGGEPASYTWDFASARAASGTLFAFSGSDQVALAGSASGACAAPPCNASVTGSTADAANWAVALFGLGAAATWTGPDGLTDYVSALASGGTASQAAAAVAGAASFTATATANGAGNWVAHLVRIRLDVVLPSASMANPGNNLSGTITLTGSASDSGSGIASVSIEISPAGTGAWTELASFAAAPYSTSLDTTTLADGLYDLRLVATDRAGNVRASTPVANRRVDNTAPSVALVDPGPLLSGSLRLTATASDSGSGIPSVRFEYAPAGTDTWTLIGTDGSAPYRTAFLTTALADGLYDLRALATDRAGNTGVSVVDERRVDNTGPIVVFDDPGAAIRLTAGLAASASDVSGVASVAFELSPAGAESWSPISTDDSEPYEAELDTTAFADGLYDLRAVASDTLGNVSAATLSGLRIDNTPPEVTLGDPRTPLSGVVALLAEAADAGAGVASVSFELARAGNGRWKPIGADTATPFEVLLDTTALQDGRYDLRAVATDVAGNTAVSALVAARRVDNTAPTTTDDAPSDWQNAAVTVTLRGRDAGSGVASTEWSLDGGPFVSGRSVYVTGDGEHTLAYFSTDLAGNTGPIKSATVKIDTTAPTVSLDDPGAFLSSLSSLSASASDGGSGVVSVEFQISSTGPNGWRTILTDSGAPWSAKEPTGLRPGSYEVRAVATDGAGNTGVSQAWTVEVRRPELGLRVRKAKTLARHGRLYLSMGVTLSQGATLTGKILSPTGRVIDRWRAAGKSGARRMMVKLELPRDFDGYCTLVVRAAAPDAKATTVRVRLRVHV